MNLQNKIRKKIKIKKRTQNFAYLIFNAVWVQLKLHCRGGDTNLTVWYTYK